MKFLRKLAFTGGMIGCMATVSMGSDLNHIGINEGSAQNDENVPFAISLNQPLSITNPYSANEAPFTIVEKAYDKAEALATTATCGGLTWTEGDYHGFNNEGDLRTTFVNGRIYIRNGSQIASNWAVLYQANNRRWSHTDEIDVILKKCVNHRDPSTATEKFLGAVTENGIFCNGKLITDRMPLGRYLGGGTPNISTYLFAHVNKSLGILRITAWRDENNNPNTYDGFNGSLVGGILRGENGSYMYPNPGFNEEKIFTGCFYNDLPVYPDQAVDPNCATAPTITNITAVSETGLTLSYSGQGVSSVKWRLKRLPGNNEITSGTVNSTTATIFYGTQQPGNYRLEIEGNNCTSGVNSRDFSIEQPPVVGTPNCATAPTISNITAVSETGLTLSYSGQGVSSVKWRLKRLPGNNEVTSGTINSTTATIFYGTQQPGNYRLEIEGNNCTSGVNSRDFSIEQPPVVGIPNCDGGPSITNITGISATTATVQFAGTNLQEFSWRILNATNQTFESGRTGRLSSKSTNIAYALPAGNYTFELTAEDCIAPAPVTRSFTVNGNDNRAICDRGPVLETIVDRNRNELNFRFDGNGVFAIDWKLKRGGQVVAESRVRPTSNTPTINYSTLPDGQYTLEIAGGSCKSHSEHFLFTLPTSKERPWKKALNYHGKL
jgi:hypothetical protein